MIYFIYSFLFHIFEGYPSAELILKRPSNRKKITNIYLSIILKTHILKSLTAHTYLHIYDKTKNCASLNRMFKTAW